MSSLSKETEKLNAVQRASRPSSLDAMMRGRLDREGAGLGFGVMRNV
jgi:hypothetical protein